MVLFNKPSGGSCLVTKASSTLQTRAVVILLRQTGLMPSLNTLKVKH